MKRFFITLGISIVVWVVSMFVQALFATDDFKNSFSLLGSSCEVTGYPIALCLSKNKVFQILAIYLVNIFFWFWIIHLFWNWFEKKTGN